ncbi:MAG: nucleoside-diphosphate kinase [Candidatus Sumerlaeia bacterium]
MVERTLVLVKPDGIERQLIGEVIHRFERKGLHVAALKMLRFDVELSRKHYAEHLDKDFYPKLEKFITSGPCVAMVLEAPDVIPLVRRMIGATNHLESEAGSIRGDFACSTRLNLVHGSDSPESAVREIPIFFNEDEIFDPPEDN